MYQESIMHLMSFGTLSRVICFGLVIWKAIIGSAERLKKAQMKYDDSMDIGVVLPIIAYKSGLQIPGQIKASFNRPRGGIAEGLYDGDYYRIFKAYL